MKKHIVHICVGSNIGNKLINCKNGISDLINYGKSSIKDQSPFYKTEPVDYKDQEWFLNAVFLIETDYTPFQLLSILKNIEQKAGQKYKPIRFGPRILDLDIVLFDDLVINTDDLIIPHPRMHKRRFVLKPMCDINPFVMHPVLKKDMQSLLINLNDPLKVNDQKVIKYKCDY